MVKKWQKYIDSLKEKDKRILIKIIEQLVSGNRKNLDIKPLKGSKTKFRCRVGNIRIIFYYIDKQVYIDKIGPRGDIYK